MVTRKANKYKNTKDPPHIKRKKNVIARFWDFLKEDTWQSWLVSLILAFVIIKFVFFPLFSFAMGTSLPLVVVESCSMYHSSSFDDWWQRNAVWYEREGITKVDFKDYPLRGGLNKGDIVIVTGRGPDPKTGDVIIFDASFQFPLIHRLVSEDPYETKGDNNPSQLPAERSIPDQRILGKSVAKIPALGWLKLIFFERFKPADERGFCKAGP